MITQPGDCTATLESTSLSVTSFRRLRGPGNGCHMTCIAILIATMTACGYDKYRGGEKVRCVFCISVRDVTMRVQPINPTLVRDVP
jgi:hypothetical protein